MKRTTASTCCWGWSSCSRGIGQRADASTVPPLPLPGPHAVACSNVAQDFGRLAPGEDVELYWEGVRRADGTPRNATDLLADPANTLSVTVNAPNDSGLYGSFAGRSIPYVVVICHRHPRQSAIRLFVAHRPVGAAHAAWQRRAVVARRDDALSGGDLLAWLPEQPAVERSPLRDDRVRELRLRRAAPFHADAAFSDLKLEDFGDVFFLLTHLENLLAMQALRPLALSATIDLMLERPRSGAIASSAGQIGGFGAEHGR